MLLVLCALHLPVVVSLTQSAHYSLLGAPGVASRCNRAFYCSPYALRDSFSLDFLCCEDQRWVAMHVLNPAFIALLLDNTPAALLVPFLWEVVEDTCLTLFKSFVFTTSSDDDHETPMGSVFGDAFVNGSLGVIIALSLRVVFGMVGPVRRWHAMANNWVRVKYVALFLGFEAGVLLVSVLGVGQDWGGFLFVAYEAAFLLLAFRYATNNESDVKRVWGGASGVAARDRTFVAYLIVAALLVLNNCGLVYLPNDWYQVSFT